MSAQCSFKALFITLIHMLFFIIAINVNAHPAHKNIENISVNFKDIPVKDLLLTLSKYSKKNIITDESVTGNVSVNLENVFWRDALNTIIKIKDLKITENGKTLFISSNHMANKINGENDERSASFQTSLVKIKHARADNIAELLTKNVGILSQDGTIIPDTRTNSLFIKDYAANLKVINDYLQQIDVPVKQVLIEARIVYADENFASELGIKFGTSGRSHGKQGDQMSMDLPVKIDEPGHIALAIAKLKSGIFLDLELSALESEGRGKIVSSPKLVTANRETAYIETGDEVPYQEKNSDGDTSLIFKKAVLGLKVTPEITSENQINLHLQLNQDRVSTVNINGGPIIQTRELKTQVLARDQETIVLGGIYEEANSHLSNKIPFLGAIPILGNFFQNKHVQTDRKELLIFVTPKILDNIAI